MEMNLRKIKNYVLKSGTHSTDGDGNLEESGPEVGFKIAYSQVEQQLKVKIISARHLPHYYGNNKAQGFLIKLTLFPNKKKYETQISKETNPVFNEEFSFDLQLTGSNNSSEKGKKGSDLFKGKFLVLTLYALLDVDQSGQRTLKRSSSLLNQMGKYLRWKSDRADDADEDVLTRGSKNRRSLNRISFNNRRTLGAVTYNLEMKFFTLLLKNKCLSTPDIWRNIQSISSGLVPETKESKNGSLEVTLTYSSSEDGNNESVVLSLSKFRCSMKTMQAHEKFGGSLYLKVTIWEKDRLISSWKSDKFEPTISMKIEPNTATLNAIFKRLYLQDVRIVLRLMCKNMLGKKTMFGKIEIGNGSEIWKKVVDSPSMPFTEMLNFD